MDTWLGVTRPKVASPTRMAGARAQQPMHRTTSRVNSMSSVVWPCLMPSFLSRLSNRPRRAFDETTGAHTDIDDVFAPGDQAEGVVEAGDAENLGKRDFQFVRDVFYRGARQPVEAPVDFQKDGKQVAGLIPVSPDDPRDDGLIRNLGIGAAGVGFCFRQLHFVTNGADFQTGAAAGALAGIDIAGFLFQGSGEIPGLAGNILQLG